MRERRSEEGFTLVGLVVAIFLILLVLAVAAPKVAKDLKRDREVEAVHRGNQYVRAVQLYYRKFGHYPGSIEQLEKTNNIRFLRQKYVDPMTGKADWRLIHLGEAKTTVKGFFGAPLTGIAPGLGSAAGLASSGGIGAGAAGASAGGVAGSSGSAFGGSSGLGSSGLGSSGSAFGGLLLGRLSVGLLRGLLSGVLRVRLVLGAGRVLRVGWGWFGFCGWGFEWRYGDGFFFERSSWGWRGYCGVWECGDWALDH